MLNRCLITIISLLISFVSLSQIENEIAPPYNIKTVSFVQNNQNVVPVFRLGERFQLQFDDLFGNDANYYYSIKHCDYNWKKSTLNRNEYLRGFDDLRIVNITQSFNTLQMYSHFTLEFPNKNSGLLVSGNYIIEIVNDNKEIVFSRKFVLYEDLVTVPMTIRRGRTVADMYTKHNIEFIIRPTDFNIQNPLTNINVCLFQNGQFENGIRNIRPMYTMGTDLIYKYDKETQFWAGNEFRNFDSKDIRNAANNISYVDSKGNLYNSHLFMDEPRRNKEYFFNPDYNGNFSINRLDAEFIDIESDYSWVYFTLATPTYFEKKDIYINGMFNNYVITPENKMEYNSEKGIYETQIMIKQGFTNYQYVLLDKNGKIDYENAVDGNYFQTETNYSIIVYYRDIHRQYDRVIGYSTSSSRNIIN
jgi:hypothetical protein